MDTKGNINDNRTLKTKGLQSLFDTRINIKVRVLIILALAGAVGNTLGFLANLILYGFNFVTGFCAVCAIAILLILFFGIRSKYSLAFGYGMLFVLDVLEFPLLTLTYGAVMLPYMIIGFHALVMVTTGTKWKFLSAVIGLYDVAIIIYSTINPYIFGPQDPMGLLGSAICTFIISICTVAALVILWQNVHIIDSIELDQLTKVQSRAGFIRNAKKILDKESNTSFMLLYFNVFSFKAINSIYGIEGGNKFLQQVAAHLSNSSLSPRVVGRLSADRFVCLVEKNNFNVDTICDICQVTFKENDRKVLVNLHCGIYQIDDRQLPVDSMVDMASTAMRFSHDAGNKHYAFYDSKAEATYNEETVVLGEVDKAITEEQFYPYFQPIVDCNTLEIVSAETLARWIHPDLGIISPGVFIPVLEKKNLISNLDRLMVRRVNEFIHGSLDAGQRVVPLSINLSRDDLFDEAMMKDIETMVMISSGNEYCHRFEITESVYEGLSEHMLNTLSTLRKNGAELLVDDFGKGSSTLGMITDYEFDTIKLDMQFASKIEKNEKIIGVIQSIIDMAHKLGAKVVAEGVETEMQYRILRDCGCDYAQGYYFYKPIPANEFIALINIQNK